MKVFILSIGTRGDLEPFWALGRALARHGHEVTLGTSPFLMQTDAALRWIPIGAGTLPAFKSFLSSLRGLQDRRARTLAYGRQWAIPQVMHSESLLSRTAADSHYFIGNLKFPLMQGNEAFPSAFVTYEPPERLDDLRANAQFLQPGRSIELVAVHRELVDPDSQWGSDFQFTGFWGDGGSNLPRPPDLAAFLKDGAAPVVLTMGSMLMFDANVLAATFEHSLAAIGERGVLVGAWSDLPAGLRAKGRLFVVPEVDYGWLLPRSAAVVHHGGVGTVAAVLRAGVPSVVLPQIESQARWAEILERIGACSGSLETDGLSTAALAKAISATRSPHMRAMAALWPTRLQTDRGLSAAVDLIEAHAARLGLPKPRGE